MSSVLVVPKFKKFKYMGKNDIQFIYVMVKEKFRGQNLAIQTIKESLAHLKQPVDNYWYVTNKNNIASIKVAEKLGFKLENKE
jgi:RimJ/RimL family protein N-acetyltransferase